MLSVLIPCYNFEVLSLVEKIHKQATALRIPFEIIVLDDASPICFLESRTINKLENCKYTILEKNIGRSAARNFLAKEAKYEWMLFLDADVKMVSHNFIQKYITALKTPSIIYGGIKYQSRKPRKDHLLRWVYGRKREALSVSARKRNPYISFLSLNFVVHKTIFEKVCFNDKIPNLRYEDTLFSYDLSQAKAPIVHIDNPVYHLGIDSSLRFIKKTEDALIALKYLIDQELLPHSYTKLSAFYKLMKQLRLIGPLTFVLDLFNNNLLKNLNSNSPSLFIFDLYRLCYFSKINQE
jgi:glycosyltransferase involved in cell wall biosynthesis